MRADSAFKVVRASEMIRKRFHPLVVRPQLILESSYSIKHSKNILNCLCKFMVELAFEWNAVFEIM